MVRFSIDSQGVSSWLSSPHLWQFCFHPVGQEEAQPDPPRLAGAQCGLDQAEGEGDGGELDGPDGTGGPPELPELVGGRTRRRVARTDVVEVCSRVSYIVVIFQLTAVVFYAYVHACHILSHFSVDGGGGLLCCGSRRDRRNICGQDDGDDITVGRQAS
jgi:hypothetical protein